MNWSPIEICCAGGPLPDERKNLSTIARCGSASTAAYAARSVGVRAVIVERGRTVLHERRGRTQCPTTLAVRVRPGRAHDLEVERDAAARPRGRPARAASRVERHGIARVRRDQHVEPARRVVRELAELPGEHRPDHRDVHEDEHDQREHAERHRGAEPARERIREAEPHLAATGWRAARPRDRSHPAVATRAPPPRRRASGPARRTGTHRRCCAARARSAPRRHPRAARPRPGSW